MDIRKLVGTATMGAGIVLACTACASNNPQQPSVGETVSEYASDTALTAKIKAAFVGEKSLSALDISVETTNGITTLAGRVGTQAQADLAARVARDVKGVKDVHNKITVDRRKAS